MRNDMSRNWIIGVAILALIPLTSCSNSDNPSEPSKRTVPVTMTMPELPALKVEGRKIVDDQGRTVILRAVNVNQLGDYFQGNPDVPPTIPLSRWDLEQIAQLGFNTIRLLVHWSALEPQRGVWNEAYLEDIRQAVAWARELGIYVVIDMHQDGWGKFVNSAPEETCFPLFEPAIGWDGAPEWATYTDDLPRCRLVVRELSLAVMRAWESFWQNRDGIQQHFIDTWVWLVDTFKMDPTVVGYDLINEPHPGEQLGAIALERKAAFYRQALEAIRSAETGGLIKIIFFEPFVLWSAIPEEAPFPFTSDTQMVYSPHIYAESIAIDVSLFGRVLFFTLSSTFEQADQEARAYHTPFWSGEWGRFYDDGGDYATRYAALEDQYQVSGAWWQWRQGCGDPHAVSWPGGEIHQEAGNLVRSRCGEAENPAGLFIGFEENHARVLSRPYPRRFPGTITFTSDPETQSLKLTGTADLPAAPLEVWIPGEAKPVISTVGLSGDGLRPVPGGWLLHARPVTENFELHTDSAAD